MPKILIGMAVSDYIRSQTVGALVALFKARPDMRFIMKQSPYVHDNREQVVNDFLETDCTHLFFVDSDMLFKPEVLDALLADDKEIVGANYNKRMGKEGVPVVNTRYDMPGVSKPTQTFKNYAVATGCLLIKREVFEKVPKPWFSLGTVDNWMGEDIFFGKKCKEFGIDSWINPNVSAGHIGEFIY